MNGLEYYEEGKSLYSRQKFSEALELFLKASIESPENLDFLFAIGNTYDYLSESEKAVEYFDKILALDTFNIKANIGKISIDLDLDKGLEVIELLINHYNEEGVLWAIKALILLELNRPREEVCKTLYNAFKFPKSNESYLNYILAIVYSCYLEWDKYKEYLDRSLKLIDKNKTRLDPNCYINYYDMLFDKMMIQYSLNEFDEALAICDKLLNVNGKNIDVLTIKAHIYFDMGDFERSKSTIELGLYLEPENVDLLNLKAAILELEDSTEYALKIFKKIIEIDDKYEHAWANLSKINYYKKEYSKSLKYAKKTLEINPDSCYGLYWGARALEKIGQNKLANEWRKKLSKPGVDKILLEKNLQDRLAIEPWRFEGVKYNLKLLNREYSLPNNDGRIDLLYEEVNTGDLVVVELKVVMATKSTYDQIKRYVGSIKNTLGKNKDIKGIVVSLGQDEEFKSLIDDENIIQVDYSKLGL